MAAAAVTAVLVVVVAVLMVVMAVVVVVMVMLMAVAMVVMMMIVVVMHNKISFAFNGFSQLYLYIGPMSKHLFSRIYPPPGLAPQDEIEYNRVNYRFAKVHLREREEPPMAQHNHDHEHPHTHGTGHSHGHIHENQKAVINRLARALGHLEKVKRMVEEGHDCSEVLVQLAAVRSALDNTGKVILRDHLRHCMVDAVAAGDQDAINDLCSAIDKFMK